MPLSITIVGGLPGDPSRKDVLERLAMRDANVVWNWVRSEGASHYDLSQKDLRRLLQELQTINARTAEERTQYKLVKLYRLHQRTQNQIYKNYSNPALAPDADSVDDFLEWLFSDAANLIPTNQWYGNLFEAALIALLSKLVRNKSWDKDTQGHAWTAEIDLLTQAPVSRPDFQEIAVKAKDLLGHLSDKLLLPKGGTKGTKKEWCIRSDHVGAVKKAIITRSVTPLKAIAEISHLFTDDEERPYLLNDLLNEKVIAISRDIH